MPDERFANAAQRIENGLSRIQIWADGRVRSNDGAAAAEFSHLAARHDALRDEVRGVLRALDALTVPQSAD